MKTPPTERPSIDIKNYSEKNIENNALKGVYPHPFFTDLWAQNAAAGYVPKQNFIYADSTKPFPPSKASSTFNMLGHPLGSESLLFPSAAGAGRSLLFPGSSPRPANPFLFPGHSPRPSGVPLLGVPGSSTTPLESVQGKYRVPLFPVTFNTTSGGFAVRQPISPLYFHVPENQVEKAKQKALANRSRRIRNVKSILNLQKSIRAKTNGRGKTWKNIKSQMYNRLKSAYNKDAAYRLTANLYSPYNEYLVQASQKN